LKCEGCQLKDVTIFIQLSEQYKIFNDQGHTIPDLASILELSKNETIYKWFISTFIKHGVGNKIWSKFHLKHVVSKYCTPSTEALVLLIVENSYDNWVDRAKDKDKARKDLVPTKYTNGGLSKRGGNATSKRGGGWSNDGIKRFNELLKLVNEDRISRVIFELALKHQLTSESTVRSRHHQYADSDTEEEEIYAAHEFNDVEGYVGTTSNEITMDQSENEIQNIVRI
jgi:hypothetical protein